LAPAPAQRVVQERQPGGHRQRCKDGNEKRTGFIEVKMAVNRRRKEHQPAVLVDAFLAKRRE